MLVVQSILIMDKRMRILDLAKEKNVSGTINIDYG
jgi:hypothetical protein